MRVGQNHWNRASEPPAPTGDAENSLIMPSADATPEEVLRQAELVGLTEIEVAEQP